jgi:hypothetical protein
MDDTIKIPLVVFNVTVMLVVFCRLLFVTGGRFWVTILLALILGAAAGAGTFFARQK